MNLVVDVGNTQIKFAIFDGDQMLGTYSSEAKNAQACLHEILSIYPNLTKGIISSTAQLPEALIQNLANRLQLVEFSHQSQLNFINTYKTPETLGLDRIALVAAAVELFPAQNVLVIDAGTCITYDFVDKQATYHGGVISAGMQMRFKAMHNFTQKLPLISKLTPTSTYLGQTTKEAMLIGVYSSVIHEIDGFIQDYLSDYEDLTVVLTGGDCNLLSASIKNSIFATQFFLFKGLNKILQLNSN